MSGVFPPSATSLPTQRTSFYTPLVPNTRGTVLPGRSEMSGAAALAIGGPDLVERVAARRKKMCRRADDLARAVVELWREDAPALTRGR